MALCAQQAHADFITTHDAKGFARLLIPTLSPTDRLDSMERDRGLVFGEAPLETLKPVSEGLGVA